jgi:hypothetical protein
VIPEKWETGFPIRITLKQDTPDENAAAYGEVVWVLAPLRRRKSSAGNGGKKGRFPGESTYKP